MTYIKYKRGFRRFINTCLLAFAMTTGLIFLQPQNTKAEEPYGILIIQSYHVGYPWTDSVTEGITSVLYEEEKVETYFEYMDTKRHMEKRYLNKLFQLYKDKYSHTKLDAIICSDDNALNFLLEKRDLLFPEVPIIFCGINNFQDSRIAGHKNITGVVENPDVQDTLDIALQLHPNAKTVTAVFDQTKTGLANAARLRDISHEYEGDIDFKYLTDLSIEELKQALNALSPDTIVLHLSFAKDRMGVFLSLKEASHLVNSNSSAPVYTLWGVRMAFPGHMGGKMVNGRVQGQIAAQMALHIQNGDPANSIEIVRESANVYMFDYEEITKFGLSLEDLPDNSIILNKPYSFYREYRLWVWLVTGIFIFLVFLIIALTFNILKRKRTEKALKRSEVQYRALFESAGDGIFINEINGRFMEVNQLACNCLGYSREELLQMSPMDIVIPENKDRVFEEMVSTRKHKHIVFETTQIHRDGTLIPVEASSRLIEYSGKPAMLVVARDLRERKQVEKEKLQLEVRLSQAQKMEAIGTLAGGIAHDFNNILSAIIGYTEIAILEINNRDQANKSLKLALDASKRATNLVSQILSFSRQGEDEIKPVKIDGTLKDAISMLRATLPATIEIQQHINTDSGIVKANQTKLHQIIMNLGTNAHHAMKEDGGVLNITLEQVEIREDETGEQEITQGNYLKLTISDTGQGMDQITVKRIFQPYFTTKEKGEGTGLGLAVVHGIVNSFNGTITVESDPGNGTTFHIYLPKLEDSVKHTAEKKGWKSIPHGNEHILYIDDEHAITDTGEKLLGHLGYKVSTRTSSIEALELFKAHPDRFDLLISDITMPNMTGDDLAKKVLDIRPDMPIILCTGFSDKLSEERAMNIGIKGFLHKPLLIQDLAHMIRAALS